MYCFVCKTEFTQRIDLQNHMLRHRKVDLITAAIKLPKAAVHNMSSESCTSEPAIVNVKEEAMDCAEPEENNNNCRQHFGGEIKRDCRLRRSSRLKIEDNYYIPPSIEDNNSKSNSMVSEDSDDDAKAPKRAKLRKKGAKCDGRKKINAEPVFTTPKVEKEPSSETDSCSGNAHAEHNTSERMFCNYCGSGYRTESMLADHIRHNHMNFCATCEVNIPDARRFKEHTQKHRSKVYLCPYCAEEFGERTAVMQHMQRHLDEGVIEGVFSLEAEYFSERVYMNTMYNMFNAGYAYARSVPHEEAGGRFNTEFYQVFLQYATQDVERVEHYGYLCRTCGYTLFDRSHYRDHMQIAHNVTASDMERLLSI